MVGGRAWGPCQVLGGGGAGGQLAENAGSGCLWGKGAGQ